MTGAIPVFIAALLSALVAFAALSAMAGRRDAARYLRRLAERKRRRGESNRSARPVLILAAREVRGRMAAKVIERFRLKQKIERLLETAAISWGAVGLVHRSVAAFLVGFGALAVLTGNRFPLFALGLGAAAGYVPLWWVRRAATRRVRAFEEQFPDCLEFLSRSMRAGHALSVAFEMVTREFPDPLAAEFRKAFEEQNLGQPLDVVLRKLGQRIPSMDVHFFVSAVSLQKRTGGNLAELLDKLAQIIRERFKLRARIRTVSAQGLMSGRILAAIPLGVAALMFVVNPQYARFFIEDPAGRELMAAGIGLQFVGFLIIRKIVTIEV